MKLSTASKNMKAIHSAPVAVIRADTAQDQQDYAFAVKPQLITRQQFVDLVNESKDATSQLKSSAASDPLEQAMKNNPTLIREKAEEMAKFFGF